MTKEARTTVEDFWDEAEVQLLKLKKKRNEMLGGEEARYLSLVITNLEQAEMWAMRLLQQA